jgi:hypothetical protein
MSATNDVVDCYAIEYLEAKCGLLKQKPLAEAVLKILHVPESLSPRGSGRRACCRNWQRRSALRAMR